jgi:hypothetical protein
VGLSEGRCGVKSVAQAGALPCVACSRLQTLPCACVTQDTLHVAAPANTGQASHPLVQVVVFMDIYGELMWTG